MSTIRKIAIYIWVISLGIYLTADFNNAGINFIFVTISSLIVIGLTFIYQSFEKKNTEFFEKRIQDKIKNINEKERNI